MKTLTENTTKNYEPIAVEGTDITLEFSESTRDGVRRIAATPKKNGANMGLITYNANEKSLTVSMKPLDGKNLHKLGDILGTVASCINEILGEEIPETEETEK